jgi:cold shock CspA family protein
MAGGAVHTGVVATYDERRGLGQVTDDAGGSLFGFHCTAISDGSRQIEAGTRVAFLLCPAHGGSLEATFLVPFPDSGEPPSPGPRT